MPTEPSAPAAPASTDRPVVADVMVRHPKRCGPETTLEQARSYLRDDHVHALLVVHHDRLVSVVERADLAGASAGPVWPLGRLTGRTIAPGDDPVAAGQAMQAAGRRRLAVVDERGRLVGLLCRKRSGGGFCSDAGIASRAAERARRQPRRPHRSPAEPAGGFSG